MAGPLKGLGDSEPELGPNILPNGLGIIEPNGGPFDKAKQNGIQSQAKAQCMGDRSGRVTGSVGIAHIVEKCALNGAQTGNMVAKIGFHVFNHWHTPFGGAYPHGAALSLSEAVAAESFAAA